MPTLTQRADFAEDPDIQPAIVAAMTLTAVKVANEDDTTPNNTSRVTLANAVLNAPSRHLSSFAWALSTNGTVVDKWAADDIEGAVADFEFVMGEVWDAIAGKPRPGRPTAPPVTDALTAAARLDLDGRIRDGDLDPDAISQVAPLYPPWQPGLDVEPGDLYRHDGTVVECIQAHTTQDDWPPHQTPALWRTFRDPDVPAPWVQPAGAHDAYQTGDRVTHDGLVYESTIDSNVWSPADYPQGWTEV